MNIGELNERVREADDSLRPSERRVADLLLSDWEFLKTASAFDFAVRANVSEPTIARFCKAIGMTGTRQLRRALVDSDIVDADQLA
ncbi:hypothetical protein LAV84_30570 [Rhizobium sp. VS19-DR104.2]|uniref:MurR/RpiR family transcriptional regulator n=1 Tax=unclassified Rhizobium TaxID=2613769 RepID=UPI001C5A6ABF|nr:hypothetical protein [Rhizobium sp. VS19-DR96]MBZ5769726.1 hypothetical protein [Rhizobium sp. VS19-DR129.2]MBZ5777273.1 hypothetical protein [Rhizobium sp. VS19-DRK62.2]MBZ5788396.1 hypothetical protein [Rhizobium sp. VS19-DR121]MBZ5805844.1 hypothetical protein [Rhizobium sp. VS19-DR181]MBZ5821576.1 hypothetical protein [Rhizobium sp. VS19-DR183]MBZ5833935.1 hypothetical protein [Rhizobium sp. VS19-DR104.2]MBZ5845268.1 hypothetical protein [Rhizobium sp. VS19-DR104.1]QXZ81549.1 MurR/Rp